MTRNQEVVVKNVGPQVAQVRGVSGATVMGNGDIVLIGKPGAISHVTFYANDAGDRVRCLGGNQGNSVKFSNYKKDGIEGYYRPVRLASAPAVEVPPAPPPAPSTGNSPVATETAAVIALGGVGAAIWNTFGWIGAVVVGLAVAALAFVVIRAIRRRKGT